VTGPTPTGQPMRDGDRATGTGPGVYLTPADPVPTSVSFTGGVMLTGTGVNSTYLCPDLLSIRNLGAADAWRGRLVRGFFYILRVVTGV